MRPVTGKGEDGNLRTCDAGVLCIATECEALQHATTVGSDNSSPSNTDICNHSHPICMTAIEGVKKVGVHIVCLQESYVGGGVLANSAYEII